MKLAWQIAGGRAFARWIRRGGWVPILIGLLGLAPLLWAPLDVALISDDNALPRVPAQLPLALHSWNPLLNTGTHYNVAHTMLAVFVPQAFLQWLGVSAALTQRLIAVVWFSLSGFAMYALVRAILGRDGWTLRCQVAALVAASFYMFNLFQENVWLGFNVAVLAAQTTLPALIALLVRTFDGRVRRRWCALILVPLSIMASLVGVNPPMVLVFMGTLVVFVLAYGYVCGVWHRPVLARRMGSTVGLCLGVALPLNAFWIFPFAEQLRGVGGAEVTASAELASKWLTGLSSSTSFTNVLRFQGDWTWHQGWQEPYRPWSETFRTNVGLVGLSWIAPVLALIGAIGPGPRLRPLFTIAAVGGLLLSMGTHPPMGSVYLWLVDHVPGFWIVRSPWFKFTLITTLGYGVLIGIGSVSLASWLGRAFSARAGRRWVANGVLVSVPLLVVGANLAYAYPVTTGLMFLPAEARQFLPQNHVRMPSGVSEGAEWFAAEADDQRVAMLPETTVWATEWGYNGFAPSLVQLGTTPVVYSFAAAFGSLVAPANADLNEVAYRSIYRVSTRRADEILKLMSVGYLNHATDVKYWLYGGDTDGPEWIRERLALQSGITPVRSFGPWDVYATQARLPRVFVAPRTWVVSGGVDALPPLVGSALLDQPALIFSDQEKPDALEAALSMDSLGGVVFFNSAALELVMDTLPTSFRHPLPSPGRPVSFTVESSQNYKLLLRSRDPDVFPSGTLSLDGVSLDLERPSLVGGPFWIHLGDRHLSGGRHVLEGALDETVLSEIVMVPQGVLDVRRRSIDERLLSGRLPAVLVATTERGGKVQLRPVDHLPVEIVRGEPFSDPEMLEDGSWWRWTETSNAPDAFTIINSSDEIVRSNVLLTVRSHETARDLYIYLGEEQLFLGRITAGQATDVVLEDVQISPGVNKLRLYTPYGGTVVGNRQLSFGLRENSVQVGDLRYVTKIHVPFGTTYEFEVRPYGPETIVPLEQIGIDGQNVELQAVDVLGEPTFSTVIDLEAGPHEIQVDQKGTEHYTFRLSPIHVRERPDTEPIVSVLERTPSSLLVKVRTEGPALLVFGESFDPRWTATTGDYELSHHTVNGFANGYELPDAGVHEVAIRFGPQDAFVVGVVISLVSLVVICVFAAGLGVWLCVRTRRMSTR